ICALLKLCLSSTFFQYNKVFYRQVQGMAMGAAISVTMANLVMEYVEEVAICSSLSCPLFFKRYVDDCLALINADKISDFLKVLNSVNADIKFTVEKEKNGELPFLDI